MEVEETPRVTDIGFLHCTTIVRATARMTFIVREGDAAVQHEEELPITAGRLNVKIEFSSLSRRGRAVDERKINNGFIECR